jgi:hypothetical protein
MRISIMWYSLILPFASLSEFEVVVETSASAQRYRVSSKDREGRMRVCT